MNLEYLEDPSARSAPVLLLYGASVGEVEALRTAVDAVAGGDTASELRLDALPGFTGIDGCSLVGRVGGSDLGVERSAVAPLAFQCVLSSSGWQRVLGLLEPFLVALEGTHFQYLTEVGAVDWIISTSRGW